MQNEDTRFKIYLSSLDRPMKRSRRGVAGAGRAEIHSDVQGSYTGMSEDGGRPVQDADDL